jgi:hypothetical protein
VARLNLLLLLLVLVVGAFGLDLFQQHSRTGPDAWRS